MRWADGWGLLEETFSEWNRDKSPRLGAALAYYSVFSLGPLLLIAIVIAGTLFGQEAAEGEVARALRSLVGQDGAVAIQAMIRAAYRSDGGLLTGALSVGLLVMGATGVFGQLKDALNTIWEVAPRPDRGLFGTLRDQFLSVGAVLSFGFLLMVSLLFNAAISAVQTYLGGLLPGEAVLWQGLNTAVAFGLVTLMFALLFKYLPDAVIAWRDVWLGAALTATLFTVGKLALGVYIGNSTFGSAYGAAGTLVVVLVWVYYSAQILFLGAEFTQVYANRFGSLIRPSKDAVPLTEPARQEQGIPHHPPGRTRQPGAGRPTPPAERLH